MNRPGDDLNEDAGSILRAIGSLLVALSGGGDQQATRRLLVTLDDQARERDPELRARRAPSSGSPRYPGARYDPPRPVEPPRVSRPSSVPASEPPPGDDPVEFILQDARERAQQILDESTERARELLAQQRGGGLSPADREAVDEVRRSVRGLVTEVRDVQQRLGRIESMLVEGQAVRPAAVPEPELPAVEEPVVDYAPYVPYPTTPPPATYPDSPPAGAYEAPPSSFEAVEPSSTASIPSPAPSPPRSSFSVVPPQRREWSAAASEPSDVDNGTAAGEPRPIPPDPLAGDEPPPPVPSSAVPRMRYASATMGTGEAAWDDDEEIPASPPGESGAPIATFLPADGAIVLRVTPVSGFQGLMRVQDAVARLPSVRQAAVEAYSQGEARLRIELSDATDSEEIASGLARALRSSAAVQEASEADRQLLIALR